MAFTIKVDDAQVLAALRRLADALGSRNSDLMQAIAAKGEAATRLRFRTQTAPDGRAWKPSLRVQLHGGKTLTQSGHLAGSLSHRAGDGVAEWGVNRIYAAIHQFGGTIRARHAGALRFRLANGAFAVVKAVTLPERPFLGLSADDRDDLVELIEARLRGAIHAR